MGWQLRISMAMTVYTKFTTYFAGPNVSGNRFGGFSAGSPRQRIDKLPYNTRTFILAHNWIEGISGQLYTKCDASFLDWRSPTLSVEQRPASTIITPEEYAQEIQTWDAKIGTATPEGLIWEKEEYTLTAEQGPSS